MTGSLHLCLGPMFSGKTSWLVNNLTQLGDLGFRCLLIGSTLDTREDGLGVISTHNSGIAKVSSTLKQIRLEQIRDLYNHSYNDYFAVGIDEGQFFPDISEVINLADQGLNVYVSALSGDFRRQIIGDCFSLIPHCETVTKLNAFCVKCLEEKKSNGDHITLASIQAPFTLKKFNTEIQFEAGRDQYYPVCRKHFLKS